MKRLALVLLLCTVLCVCVACGSSQDNLVISSFAVGDTQVFCPSTQPTQKFPLYYDTSPGDRVITTDTATYAVFHNGRQTSSVTKKTYRLLRKDETEWTEVAVGKKCEGPEPHLTLCSNQKGKLVVVTPVSEGIGFGVYHEQTGEFTETAYTKRGYSSNAYYFACGIDPRAGAEGKVYIIVSHSTVDKNTQLISFDIATRTVKEQQFSDIAYSTGGYIIVDDQSVAHVVLDSPDMNVHYFRVTDLGEPTQTVGAPVVIASPENDGFVQSVELDAQGKLHLFYANAFSYYYAVVENGEITKNDLFLAELIKYDVASFIGGDGFVYAVCMEVYGTEGSVIRMDDMEELLYISLEDVPVMRDHVKVANTRLGGRTTSGTYLVYHGADCDDFVSLELIAE